MLRRIVWACSLLLLALPSGAQIAAPPAQSGITAIRAGRLIDPETGMASANQIILIQGERIREVGPNVPIPPGASVIDLSKLTVLPGLVDAHEKGTFRFSRLDIQLATASWKSGISPFRPHR